ncbi:hypothetical protein Q2T48_33980, partial [Pseudomonas aeruginosa]|uniref:hypothetical protein n=1 Tax=Pseudomonas aeruginosa TaxID=287 RepID=UPI00265E9FAD
SGATMATARVIATTTMTEALAATSSRLRQQQGEARRGGAGSGATMATARVIATTTMTEALAATSSRLRQQQG